MEKELDEVEEGEKQWVAAVRDFYLPFSKDIEKAKHLPGPKDTVQPPTNIPCEKCGRMMEIKWGRNGKFLACPGYKEDPPCKNTQNFERLPDGTIKIVAKQEVATDEKCEKCGSPMVIKSGRFGKSSRARRTRPARTRSPSRSATSAPRTAATSRRSGARKAARSTPARTTPSATSPSGTGLWRSPARNAARRSWWKNTPSRPAPASSAATTSAATKNSVLRLRPH